MTWFIESFFNNVSTLGVQHLFFISLPNSYKWKRNLWASNMFWFRSLWYAHIWLRAVLYCTVLYCTVLFLLAMDTFLVDWVRTGVCAYIVTTPLYWLTFRCYKSLLIANNKHFKNTVKTFRKMPYKFWRHWCHTPAMAIIMYLELYQYLPVPPNVIPSKWWIHRTIFKQRNMPVPSETFQISWF